MPRTFFFDNEKAIRRAVPILKNKINVDITFKGRSLLIKGKEYSEYICEKILRAIDFGFEIDDALLLTDENYQFEILNIKNFTPRKNLSEIRARVIGKDGKSKKTIEEITGSKIVIRNNKVGIISDNEHIQQITQGFSSLIHGAKHANVFSYLEKQNTKIKEADDDLGLKDSFKKFNKV